MLSPTELLCNKAIIDTLISLEKIGVLGFFTENQKELKGVSLDDLCKNFPVSKNKLEVQLEFLTANAPELIIKKVNKYYLSRIFRESEWQNVIHFATAYQSVFCTLDTITTNTSKYGIDIVRDGAHLARSSSIHNQRVNKFITRKVGELDCNFFIDCGCGDGRLLCEVVAGTKDSRGYGIDIDANAITALRSTISELKLQNKVFPIQANIDRPSCWSKDVVFPNDMSRVLFLGSMVWHEFLHIDGHFVSKIKEYRKLFKGAYFMMTEYNGIRWEDMPTQPKSLREGASVYQLLHPVTDQGMPRSQIEWLNILKACNVNIKNVWDCKPNSTVYLCRL